VLAAQARGDERDVSDHFKLRASAGLSKGQGDTSATAFIFHTRKISNILTQAQQSPRERERDTIVSIQILEYLEQPAPSRKNKKKIKYEVKINVQKTNRRFHRKRYKEYTIPLALLLPGHD